MNIADQIVALQTSVTALSAQVAALPAATGGTTDLTPVLTAIADFKADVDAQLIPTPAP